MVKFTQYSGAGTSPPTAGTFAKTNRSGISPAATKGRSTAESTQGTSAPISIRARTGGALGTGRPASRTFCNSLADKPTTTSRKAPSGWMVDLRVRMGSPSLGDIQFLREDTVQITLVDRLGQV